MLSLVMISLALASLGVELSEGADPKATLDSTLEGYGLTSEQFLTEDACFTIGYHRGMIGAPFDDNQVPAADGKPITALERAVESGYAMGLEARDVKLTPPPSLVLAGWKTNAIKPGQFADWAATLDLSSSHRLAVALTVGSGKDARTIPAGTPVDLLAETTKDGVAAVVVMYDGLPLIVPNPADAPRIIAASSAVVIASEKKARVSKPKVNADGTPKPAKEKVAVERGPSLRDAIVYVIQGEDGGPGPLQSNSQIASRVRARCVELGIGDKAATFLKEADRHAPYYLNIYKPNTDDANVVTGPGRLGVTQVRAAILYKIESRKYFLKGEGLTAEARYANIPAELRAKIETAGDTIIVAEVKTAAPAA
jgi:hypothetical protein